MGWMIRLVNYFLFSLIFIVNVGCKMDGFEKPKQPNVVFILVDDLGWTDLGCYGSDLYETPNIDQLAAEGTHFTNAYAACTVCSPTRASIMSGKYPATINCTDWIEGWKYPFAKLSVPEWNMKLDTTEYTLAEAFRHSGYATAHIGKWHLGEDSLYWPENHGFDKNIGGYRKGAPMLNKKKGLNGYFSPYGNPRLNDGPEGEYLTERLANEASAFIADNKDRPFFLNLWFYNVHTPLQARQAKIDKYKARLDSAINHTNPVYAAMVEHVDEAVGALVQQLKDEGLYENTIIILTSDNGGLTRKGKNNPTNNYPLRSGKGDMYEGGIRVPLIVMSPQKAIKPKTVDTPVISCDFFPTLANLCDLKLPTLIVSELDGINISPLLVGESIKRDVLFWHYPHYHIEGAKPHSAIRKGNWKLIHKLESDSYELYNLKNDISEKVDLAEVNHTKLNELKEVLVEMKLKTLAQEPTINSHFNPEKANQTKWKD